MHAWHTDKQYFDLVKSLRPRFTEIYIVLVILLPRCARSYPDVQDLTLMCKILLRIFTREEGIHVHAQLVASRPDVLYLASATFLPTFY